PKEENPVIDAKNLKDGEYSIVFEVLENNTNNKSMMDQYVVNTGLLTVKDGKKYISATFTDSAWITDFQVDFKGKYMTPEVVSADEKANTRVVKFEVE
ncbi:NEAT domain-containing protein, partial [Microvirga sp. 3-52]|nr:NEAT domain-containing protein [Microvirga sp. 3-52]